MSAPALALSGPVKQEMKLSQEARTNRQQEIANLAYVLWQHRGCPQGTAEQDWIQAEQMVAASRQI
jgi:hypothetical protein